jgi:beta-glucosidase
MEMPASHNELIARVSAANHNTVVILSGGSPVEMPWIGGVKGLLQSHLGGQAGASAVVDVIFGAVNPSGKLAETYPIGLSDTPCFRYFGKGSDTAEYRESIYVGYRFYDTAGRDVLFPFGFGLSYTQFEYSNISVSGVVNAESDTLTVNVQVKNIGDRAGAEIIQLYVKPPKSAVFKAEKELKGFEKVFLEPDETKNISFILNRRAFSYYNSLISDWHAEGGLYDILIGASSRDIRLRSSISIENRANDILVPDLRGKSPCYYDIGNKDFEIPDSDFENLYGGKLPPAEQSKQGKVTQNTALEDISAKLMGRIILAAGKANIKKQLGSDDETDVSYRVMWYTLTQSPLRIMVRMGDGSVTDTMLNGLIEIMNGHLFKGLKLLSSRSECRRGMFGQ